MTQPREVDTFSTEVTTSRGRVDLYTKLSGFIVTLVVLSYAVHDVLRAQHAGAIATLASVVVMAAVACKVAHTLFFRAKVSEAQGLLSAQLEAAQAASQAHLIALDQLRHSDRIATLGRLASSVAHELGNPLSVIELRAQLITSGDADSLLKVRVNAAVIADQARRMTEILDQILSFARMQPAKLTRLELGELLRRAIALSEHTTKKHKTQIVLNLPQLEVALDGDSNRLLQVVINLVMNGLQAMPHGGLLEVNAREERCAPVDDSQGAHQDFVCIDVVDHGTGIAPRLYSRVFDPFYSTKSEEGGTGLGLSVAQGIAHEHDGWISVHSELGVGSCFTVHLPKWRASGSAP